jgi:hypothetical protein
MPVIYKQPPLYRTYLLSCWEMRSQYADRPSTWRLSLQDSQTGRKCVFPDLEALVIFLEAELELCVSERTRT